MTWSISSSSSTTEAAIDGLGRLVVAAVVVLAVVVVVAFVVTGVDKIKMSSDFGVVYFLKFSKSLNKKEKTLQCRTWCVKRPKVWYEKALR